MSANTNVIDESVDDGISLAIFNEFYDGMDKPELQVDVHQTRTAQIAQERLRLFNEAWNIPVADAEAASTSTSSARPSTSNVAGSINCEPLKSDAPPAIPEQTIQQQQTITPAVSKPTEEQQQQQGSPSALQIVDDKPKPAASNVPDVLEGSSSSNNVENMPPQQEPLRPRISNGRRSYGRRRRNYSDDEDHDDDYEGEMDNANANGYRNRPQSRPRPRSRYYSRSRSRSPDYSRRRRRRSRSRSTRYRSRSPPRSRSFSRSSSERENRRTRTRSRRDRHADRPAVPPVATNPPVAPTADYGMVQTVVSAAMQAIGQLMTSNRMQPTPAQPLADVLQAVLGAHGAPLLVVNHVPSVSPTIGPAPATAENASQIQPEPAANDVEVSPYDVSTELFLEGRLSFGDFLALKPSCREQRTVNAKVCERIKEAISVLDRQETKEQTTRFFYVPPTYYSEPRKMDNTRSPLIWNERNVLFGLTCSSREAKLGEPFGNVNGKLKGLIAKLGLDEGVISQQLQKIALAAATSTVGAEVASSRIQAISTVRPKPGSAKVRHMIERAVQTDGYACGECVARTKRTFVSSASQTRFNGARKVDMGCQTSTAAPGQQSNVPTITLENLTPSQIETIDAIVRFIRNRHITGPVDSVHHALNKDNTARATMGAALFQTAQSVVHQMTEQARRPSPEPYVPSPPSASTRYVVNFPLEAPSGGFRNAATSSNFQQQHVPPPVPPTGGRYCQPYNAPVQLVPAGYAPQVPPMSKKAKKRAFRR